jgi:Concanavalin A-like lectin/glucanases superfamily
MPDAFTKLLLHCNGADGSTAFPDSSTVPKTVTAVGNAQVDTAQSKFGGASALFDGTGDYLTLADSTDWEFGNGDFTIDFWVRFSNKGLNAQEEFVSQYAGGANKGWDFAYANGSTLLRFNRSTTGSDDVALSVTWAPADNTWYHVALTRNGADLRFFVNGTQQGATQNIGTATIFAPNAALMVGSVISGGINNLAGWLDEVRISKGIARWTANFTPPTAPYNGVVTNAPAFAHDF